MTASKRGSAVAACANAPASVGPTQPRPKLERKREHR